MPENISDKGFKARPYEPLFLHTALVSLLARSYGEKISSADITKTLGLLHDIGKCTEKFKQVLEHKRTKIDHAEVGAQVLQKLYEEGCISFRKNTDEILNTDNNGIDERMLYIMMNIIAGHHSKFWESYQDPYFIKKIGGIFNLPETFSHPNITHDNNKDNALSSEKELESVTNYAKELLGSEKCIISGLELNKMNNAARMLYCRMLFSCLVDADYTAAAFAETHKGYKYDDIPTIADKLLCENTLDAKTMLNKLENEHKRLRKKGGADKKINILRNKVYVDAKDAGKTCLPGLYTMTAPTGLGKTIALMKFGLEQAKRNGQKRVIVVLPYLSIIQQNKDKYKKIFEDELNTNIVIEADGNTQLNDKEFSDRWNAPIIVTTSVTFFETLFSASAPALRKLHRIADSIIVFDEAQTLEYKLLSITIRTLEALGDHFGATVLLSTATQPSYNDRKDLDARMTEIIQNVPELYAEYGKLKNTTTEFSVSDKKYSYKEIADKFKDEEQCLYIVNTTKKAWALYSEVRALHPDCTYLLTGLQAPCDKLRIIDIVKKRLKGKEPVHLISTQCIEAGVDIDFKCGCREYAPLTSIIQSAGRINRECEGMGYVLIFMLEDTTVPGDAYRTEMSLSFRMAKKQDGRLDVNDQSVINRYYQKLYKGNAGCDQGYTNRGFIEDTISYAEQEEDLLMMDKKYKLIEDECSCTVIVPSPSDKKELYRDILKRCQNSEYIMDIPEIRKIMKTAHDITVRVSGNQKRQFVEAHCEPIQYIKNDIPKATGWYIATDDIYDGDTGLKLYP